MAQNRFGPVASRKAGIQAATLSDSHVYPQAAGGEEGVGPAYSENPRAPQAPHHLGEEQSPRWHRRGEVLAAAQVGAADNWPSIQGQRVFTVTGLGSGACKEPAILVGPESLTLTLQQAAVPECVTAPVVLESPA